MLLVFVVSGWIVNQILANPETLGARTILYETRFWSALTNPFAGENARNIYFGIIMGASALLPTLFHIYLAIRSALQSVIAGAMRTQED